MRQNREIRDRLIDKEASRQTGRKANMLSDRQTGKQTDSKQADMWTCEQTGGQAKRQKGI